jgi:tight adherence protein B
VRLRASLVAVASAVVAAALATSASAATADQPKLTPAGGSTYPTEAYVLTLPAKTKLDASKVAVYENGQLVNDVQVTRPGATGAANFGVVLLIDASNSMKGKPIAGAMAAARAFEAKRNPGQQLALITFNNATHTLLNFTTDSAAIKTALARTPTLALGTHIYDAIGAADQLLRTSGIKVGAIVLLSDGKDVGSTTNPNDALNRIKDAKTRIFSVGLQSKQFDPATLQKLASDTDGTFSVATDASKLSGIFSALGYTLSNEYLVRYHSLTGPNARVHVVAKVTGYKAPATTNYKSPPLPTYTEATGSKSTWDRIIQSPTTAALVIAALVGLIGFAVYLLLRRRDQRFQQRMGEFVTLPLEERAQARREDVATTLGQSGRTFSLGGFAWYTRLERDVEIGRIRMRPAMIVALTILGGLILGVVVAAIANSPWGLLAGFAAIPVTRAVVARRVRKVRRDFGEQLPDDLDVLGSALRAGHSFVGALSVAVEDASEPSRSEFRRVVADEQLGVPLEDALKVTAMRMENRDLIQVALVARLQRDAGTNAAEVLDQVATNVRNRMEIHRLIRTLTAQGRMARWIVSLLPVFLFFAILLLNHHYLSPLWQTNLGIAAMILAGIMIVAGSLVIKRIIEIEV